MMDTDNVNPNEKNLWMKTAKVRASARTFTIPTDSKGRLILSFWMEPRGEQLKSST